MNNKINEIPLQTTANLLREFPTKLPIRNSTNRVVPVGIEVEVLWRAYFPDLWVEGFPNVDEETLARISAECSIREKTLIPMLMKTQHCGINRGADRYWEFALDPVQDVGIACDHIAILREHNLIPPGRHSLHITFGGLKLDKHMYFVAMVLEALACSSERVLSGFHPSQTTMPHGWARKGFAGLFFKEGDHDILHNYGFGTEIRLLYLPETDQQLFELLDLAQRLAEIVKGVQQNKPDSLWDKTVANLSAILTSYGLPNNNWKKPHINPDVWTLFAQKMPEIQRDVRQLVSQQFSC